MAKIQTAKSKTKPRPTNIQIPKTEVKPEEKVTPKPETPMPEPEKVVSKVTVEIPDEKIPVTRSVAFYNRSEVVVHKDNRDKHLIRYLGVEHYWSMQQIEICLKDLTVTLVIDGSTTGIGRYLEFPRKTQIILRNKNRKPCRGCS